MKYLLLIAIALAGCSNKNYSNDAIMKMAEDFDLVQPVSGITEYPAIGQIGKIWDIGWVKVLNPDGVSNGNCYQEFGETCYPEKGSICKCVAIDSSKGLVLCEYLGNGQGYGTLCGIGVLFFIPADKFLLLNSIYKENKEKLESNKRYIEQLVEKERVAP